MKEQKVWFKNSRGQKLCGVVSIPEGEGPFPAVILCHGLWSNKYRNSYVELTKLLCKKGIASLRFDMLGHGESDGDVKEITVSTGVESLNSALDFICKQDFVDKNKLGLFGASYGGSVVIAGFDKKFKVVVLKCPASNYKKTREIQLGKKGIDEWRKRGWADIKGHILGYCFFEDLLKNHADQYLDAEKISVPTLIIHGDVDKTVPLAHSKALYKTLNCEKRLEIIDGAWHRFKEPEHFDKVLQLSADWFKEHL